MRARAIAGHAVVRVDHGQSEPGKGIGIDLDLPALRTAAIPVRECAMQYATLPYATVEHDPHVAPVLELPA